MLAETSQQEVLMEHEQEDQMPSSDDEQVADNLPLVEVEALEGRLPSRRKRMMQLSLALGAVMAALVVFRGVFLVVQPPAPAPTSNPPLPPLALFASNVTFGAMQINGRTFAKPPVLIPVPQDAYSVTLAALPFRPVTCHITNLHLPEPDIGSDAHCQIAKGSFGSLTLNGITGTPTFLISISLGLDDLPPDQQATARSVIGAQVFSLHQQTTVPAGDYYATAVDQSGSITSQRATRPLQAEASLVSRAGLQGKEPFSCRNDLVCAGPVDPRFLTPSSGKHDWLVQIVSALHWRFTTDTGQVMGEATYLFYSSTYRYLSYDAVNGWMVDEVASQILAGQNELGNANCQAGIEVSQSLPQGTGVGFNYNSDSSIQGCFLLLGGGSTGQGQLLWRFGVLLAVDQQAHSSFPTLPLAPKQEIAAVEG
jgi:hypothetical protein